MGDRRWWRTRSTAKFLAESSERCSMSVPTPIIRSGISSTACSSEWIVQLQESPEVIARAEAIKQQILDPETSGRLAASLWNEVKRRWAARVPSWRAAPSTPWPADSRPWARAALEDEALLQKIDGWVIAAVLRVVEQHRHEVGQLIAQTVSAWDPEETSRRIELLVGRDLQFIRINGTLVGGLVGLIIYSVTRLL